ncbi:Xylosidase/arabinosidase [Cytospora mali]|uniref:Xylosidase/arabinosidase n=1 Tax=Cytospora mali TaxID=578113 RepID=A0A194UP76_CYTMA|nr:Xylosidase/arabinosidase [Valsa mali var. pyri (nom. inval.)]
MRSTALQAILALAVPGIQAAILDYTTSEAGNPFVDGWYADPDTEIYDGLYWVYPTSSYDYEQQTYLDAFSSPDLINWTKHPNILTNANVTWANGAVWAPAAISRNGKYYIYFGANDIQEGDNTTIGGIGVAVADNPAGPYVDAIGAPLIGAYHNGAQPIDQDVFLDDDGRAYIYYGGHSHANVALLNEDMISIGTFPDGTQYKEITPTNYVEGAQMVKRNGIYYMMWSEGGWTGPDYAVSYAMSDSPLGPFNRKAKILQQDPAVATGSGHNGVFNVPGTDIWYIVYHRRPLGDDDGNHRQLAYDRMYFEEDGSIANVTMLVKDNFADGNTIGWTAYGGDWSVLDGQLKGAASSGGKTFLDTNFTSLVYDADVTITGGDSDGHAGVVFRASTLGKGTDEYNGYYAGIKLSGEVLLGRANGSWTELKSTQMDVSANTHYHIRVKAVGSDISIFVDNMDAAKITVTDDTYSEGQDGVRVYAAEALFDNISVATP